MKINWSVRLRNKAFWVGLAAALLVLAQQLGIDFLPENSMDIVNSCLMIGTILGIIVDPTTDGMSDSQRVLNKNKEENTQ